MAFFWLLDNGYFMENAKTELNLSSICNILSDIIQR